MERNLSILALGSDILTSWQQKWNWPFYHLPHAIYSPAEREFEKMQNMKKVEKKFKFKIWNKIVKVSKMTNNLQFLNRQEMVSLSLEQRAKCQCSRCWKKIIIHALYLSGGTRLFQQSTQLWDLERILSFLALGSDILTPWQQKWNWPIYHLPHAFYSPGVR